MLAWALHKKWRATRRIRTGSGSDWAELPMTTDSAKEIFYRLDPVATAPGSDIAASIAN